MAWSPLDAMKAYMHTLQLCKDHGESSMLLEPKSMEYISALAAGNGAQLLVDISSCSMSPITLALAVAAKHTRGRLVCVRSEHDSLEQIKTQLQSFHLADVVELRLGNPSEVMKQCKNVDFAVVDQRVRGCFDLFLAMDMNPSGSTVVVVNNVRQGRRTGGSSSYSYAQVVKGGRREGMESVVLPIGEGMEVTRIGKGCSKRAKRRFRVYEDLVNQD